MVLVSKPVLTIALIKLYPRGRQEIIISFFASGILRFNVCWLLYLLLTVTALQTFPIMQGSLFTCIHFSSQDFYIGFQFFDRSVVLHGRC